ncbi:MAG: PD-(D/E)XK nuclease family protein [Nitrospirota bacterium]|jgi:putative RecB family exonuclease
MATYSHSKLSTYENCPLQYKLHYIDEVEVAKRESIEAFLGKRVHDTFERLYKDLKCSKLMTFDELISYYNEQWDKSWNDAVVIRDERCSAQNYKDIGIKCLRNYYDRHAPFSQSTTIWIEEKKAFSLSEGGKYKIRGVIDRLDKTREGIYEIHDYKTSGRPPLQEELEEDRQLALYELLVREKFPDVKEVRLIWHFLRFDMEMLSARTLEQLEDLRKETIALIDTIESDKEFKHNETALCDWCDYWAYCPAKKHLVKVEALPVEQFLEEDGVKLVNEYVLAWNRSKEADIEKERLKERLAVYAKKEGVETIKGSDYTVKVAIKDKLYFPGKNDPDREELEKIIKIAGLWDEASELDVNVLSKTIQSGKWDKELIKKIKQFASEEESVRVSQPKLLREEE